MRRILTAASVLLLAGCTSYNPGGPGMSNNSFAYESYAHIPQTISLRDTRTDQVLWTYEIPVGRKLGLAFYRNRNIDDPMFPDMMAWGEMAIGQGGELVNQMAVPPPGSRIVETTVRAAPELPQTNAAAK